MRDRNNRMKKRMRDIKAAFLAIALMAGGATAVHAAESDGTFDTSWAGSGIMYGTNIPDAKSNADTKVLSNDNYVVVTRTKSANANTEDGFIVSQYLPTGILDTSFSGDGMVTAPLGSGMTYMVASHMQILSDGSILVIGHWGGSNGGGSFIYKFTSAGALDTTFGTGGLATASTLSNDSELYYTSFIASSGNIYILSNMSQLIITRYTSSGALDTSGFGTSSTQGYYLASSFGVYGDNWRGFSVDETSGAAKILMWGGNSQSGNIIATRWNMAATNGRISPSSVDTTYGTNGVFSYSPGGAPTVMQVSDTARSETTGLVYARMGTVLTAFNPVTATKITSFGVNGSEDLALLQTGLSFSISVSSVSGLDVILAMGADNSAGTLLIKLDNNGDYVQSFDGDGMVYLTPCASASYRKALRRSDGKVLVSGYRYNYDFMNPQGSTFYHRQILLGNGGSTTQCGTTTTTTTYAPSNGGGGGGGGGIGGGGGGMLPTPVATAVEVPGQGIRISISNLVAGARYGAFVSPVGIVTGGSTGYPYFIDAGSGSSFLITDLQWTASQGSNASLSRRSNFEAGVSYQVRIYQFVGNFYTATYMSMSALRVVQMTASVTPTSSTGPATSTTTTTVPKAVVATTVIPGVTVTDTKVYTAAPAKVASASAIDVLTPAQAKTSDIVSKTPSVCLPNDEDLVFIDEGRCIAQVVNEKTRKVLRTLKTTVVEDEVSDLKVGNEIAVLSPLYFTAGTATMKQSSIRRLNSLIPQVKAAGSILVAGHSGVLMGDTPEN